MEDDPDGRLSVFDSSGKLTFRRRFGDLNLNEGFGGRQKGSVAVAADGSIFVYVPGVPNLEECPIMFKFDAQLNELAAADADCSGGGGALDGDFQMAIDPLGLLYVLSGATVDIYDSSFSHQGDFQFTLSGSPEGGTDSLAVDSQGVVYEATGSSVGIINNGQQTGFVSLPGQFLWAGPDRSLFVANQNDDTLSNYPSQSNQVQMTWDLPAQPIGVYADQSRVYAAMVGSVPGLNRQTITLAVYSNVFISNITPPTGGDTGTVTVTIGGRGFQQGASVALARSGQSSITATSATFTPDGTSATAQFNLAGAADGAWDVVVTNPDGTSSTLPGGFSVAPGGTPLLWVRILGRSIIRTGLPSQLTLVYGNAGNVDAPGIDIDLSVPAGLTLNTPAPVAASPTGKDLLFADSLIPSGASRAVPITVTAQPSFSSGTLTASWFLGGVPALPLDPFIDIQLVSAQATSSGAQMTTTSPARAIREPPHLTSLPCPLAR